MSSNKLTIVLFSLIIIPAIACGGASSQTDQQPTQVVVELATPTSLPTAKPISEATIPPEPTVTPEPTATPIPAPTYQEPITLLEHSAAGERALVQLNGMDLAK